MNFNKKPSLWSLAGNLEKLNKRLSKFKNICGSGNILICYDT